MSRIVTLIVVLVVGIIGLSFAVLNSQEVALRFYIGEVNLPLSIALVFALVLGALLGVLASLGQVFRLRRDVRRLKKSVEMTEKEVASLRALPLKDNQ